MGIYFATDIDRINNEYMPRLNLEIGRYINILKAGIYAFYTDTLLLQCFKV